MNIKKLTSENFEMEVLNSEKPVLVDFWAEWCGPCRMLGPILEEVASEMENAVIGKVNIDQEIELARKYNVMSIPTLILFVNGSVKTVAVGLKPKQELIDMINKGSN